MPARTTDGAVRLLSVKRFDLLVLATLVALIVLQLAYTERAGQFIRDDVLNWELARSISQGTYQFNGKPETLYPPVFPLLLLLTSFLFGAGHGVLVRSMAVFGGFALLVAYPLLTRLTGRGIAAASCLLVASSVTLFALTTRWVIADLPFFATVMVALYSAALADAAPGVRRRRVQSWLLAASVVAALLIRSAAIGFLLALPLWLAATFVRDRASFSRRVRIVLPALLLGLLTQGAWAVWASREAGEWWVGDFPGRSYFFQVQLKSGPKPELGFATLGDLPPRIEVNLRERVAGLSEVIIHRSVAPEWPSLFVSGTLILVLAGWLRSVSDGGGGLHDWFFASHELTYLLWPWPIESRFLLPVAPLVPMYAFRGPAALWALWRERPRAMASIGVPIAALLAVAALVIGGGRAIQAAGLCWAVLTIALLVSAVRGFDPARWVPSVPRTWRVAAATAVVAFLILLGLAAQVRMGRQNLAFDLTAQGFYPDIDAAWWLRDHTPQDAVIMARQLPVAFRHGGYRRTVWLPPITDPQTLMDGISRYGVQYLAVVDGRQDSYFLPPDDECVAPLLARYPAAFRLVHQGVNNRIFQVVAPPGAVNLAPARGVDVRR